MAISHRCTMEGVIQEISSQLGKAQAASGLFQRTWAPEPEL
jgi:hypothetical protein